MLLIAVVSRVVLDLDPGHLDGIFLDEVLAQRSLTLPKPPHAADFNRKPGRPPTSSPAGITPPSQMRSTTNNNTTIQPNQRKIQIRGTPQLKQRYYSYLSAESSFPEDH